MPVVLVMLMEINLLRLCLTTLSLTCLSSLAPPAMTGASHCPEHGPMHQEQSIIFKLHVPPGELLLQSCRLCLKVLQHTRHLPRKRDFG